MLKMPRNMKTICLLSAIFAALNGLTLVSAIDNNGPPNIRPPNVGPPNIRPPNVGPPNIRPPNVGPPNIRPPNVGPPNVGPPNVGPPIFEPPIVPDEATIRKTFKKLFVHSAELSPEEARRLLVSVENVTESNCNLPFGIKRLISFSEITQEKCSEPRKPEQMRDDFARIKKECPALVPYVAKCFSDQFKLCGFDRSYKEDFKNFKARNTGVWNKMNTFKNRVTKFGKPSKDIKDKDPDNPKQFNEAFTDMYNDYKFNTESKGKSGTHRVDASIQAYKDMQDIRYGSQMFHRDVHPNMDMANWNPYADRDQELQGDLEHNNVYQQVGRNNFEPSMASMFADAHYDEGDKTWQAYESYRDYWGLS